MAEVITTYKKTVTDYICPVCGEGRMTVDPIWAALGPDKYPDGQNGIPHICDQCWTFVRLEKQYPIVVEIKDTQT